MYPSQNCLRINGPQTRRFYRKYKCINIDIDMTRDVLIRTYLIQNYTVERRESGSILSFALPSFDGDTNCVKKMCK